MISAVERRTQQIPASGEIALAPANFFFLESASAAVTVEFQGQGGAFGAANVTAGILFGRLEDWKRAVIRGAPGTLVNWFYGDMLLREDVTDFRTQIATIGGITLVQDSPAAAIADTADTVQGVGTQTAIAQDLTRRWIEIGVLSSSNNSVRVSQAGGAGRGKEIQPGTSAIFPTTAALVVRNDDTFASGAAATWWAERF